MGESYYTGHFDTNTVIVTITTALSLYNSTELLLLIFITFTVYRGLYFWSLLVATTGLIPYAVGLILQYFRVTHVLVGLIINNYGWWTTVTGQSVVLYSRLGVVLGKGNERILKWVKWMIIIDAFLFHVTTTVVVFGSYYASQPAEVSFSNGYNYVEKIQMTGFCVQEFIISGLYLWKTMDIVKTQSQPVRSTSTSSDQGKKSRVRRVMWQLFVINIVIVIMDTSLLVIEYKDLHVPEVAFKGLCYSVKLKLEFAVLSKLVEVAGIKRTQGVQNTLDSNVDVFESAPHRDVTLDSKPQLNVAKGTHGSPPSTPPEWLEDLEKIRSRPAKGFQPALNNDVEKSLQEPKTSHVSTFDNISVAKPPVHRRVRRDSDLLYADALRDMSKS